MTATVKNETKEVLNKIENHLADLNRQVEKLDHLTTIKVSQAEIKGEMTGVNKRLDNAEFINRTIFASIVIAIAVSLIRNLGLFPNR